MDSGLTQDHTMLTQEVRAALVRRSGGHELGNGPRGWSDTPGVSLREGAGTQGPSSLAGPLVLSLHGRAGGHFD